LKTVLVTGATGGLGRNAVEALLERGIAVRATGRNIQVGTRLSEAGADFRAADLSRLTAAEADELLKGVDTVWHCAALSAPWGRVGDFVASNVTATQTLLFAAGRARVGRFIHISTPALYFDYQHHRNITESYRAEELVNQYAMTKRLAELAVTESARACPDMHHVILRPRAIFGPYDQVLLPRVDALLQARGGQLPLPRAGQTVLDLTYVANVVHAMVLASAASHVPSGSVYNVTNDEPRAIGKVLEQLFVTELGRPFKIASLPYPVLDVAARALEVVAKFTGNEPKLTRYSIGALAFDMTLDLSAIKADLGYAPVVSMDEGIRRTAVWMKNHG
jgi:nucleoside-diphosphate-sugar epimerase